MKRFCRYLFIAAVFSFTAYPTPHTLSARVINIPDDEETIQSGIDAAEDGDTVLVQPGTYYENINFEGKAITVGSLFLTTGNEAYIDSTVINGDSSGCVVLFENGESENTVLTGFTITNGSGTISGRYLRGGGIYCNEASPTIEACVIRDNFLLEVDGILNGQGAGICLYRHSDALITNCRITNNINHFYTGDGGGIYCYFSSPLITNCTIEDNSAPNHGYGGGLYFWYFRSHPVIENCVINQNEAGSDGGGLVVFNRMEVTIRNTIISRNRAGRSHGGIDCSASSVLILENCTVFENEGHGGALLLAGDRGELRDCVIFGNEGGGVTFWASEGTLERCLIFNNTSVSGAGVYCYGNSCSLIMLGCTIVYNSAEETGGGIFARSGIDVSVVNTILWGNEPNEVGFDDWENQGSISFSYSLIDGGMDSIDTTGQDQVFWLEGNIDEDPLFADPDNDDFHLTAESPCIDAGDPEFDLDPDGTITDIGAFYFHQRDIEIEPETISFETPGTPDSAAVTIRNIGLTALTITSQSITPDDSPFSIGNNDGEFEIEPDGEHITLVRFEPDMAGEYEAVLTIESDDPDEEAVEILLRAVSTGIEDDKSLKPLEFGIAGVYPNPFNSQALVRFSVPFPADVTMKIYDISGRERATL
ncbi:right-handed parallel beta-helix repeat-containing protein [bacterium]|nr:right-handed parallel beta-helix repeat-containing protein [bacterium]